MMMSRFALRGASRRLSSAARPAAAHPALSEAEARQYAEDGYVVPAWRLPAAELASCRAALDALLADNPSVPPELLVNAHLAEGEGGSGAAMGVRGRAELLRLATLEPLVEVCVRPLSVRPLFSLSLARSRGGGGGR